MRTSNPMCLKREKNQECLQHYSPKSDRSLLLLVLDLDSMLLLLKSDSLCTSLLQDNLRGLLSTGDGGELPGSLDAGMFVLFAVVIWICLL